MKYLLAALLFFSSHAFAQDYEITETPFNKFVKQPSVVWAVYANDTISFDLPHFSATLLNKIKKGRLKISNVLEPGTQGENHVRLKSKKSADSIFLSDPVLLTDVGEQGISKWVYQKDRIYDQLKSSPFYASQIFYISSGKLKSYVPHLSPTANFITASGIDLGQIRFFTTAINFSYSSSFSSKDKIIYLVQTHRVLEVDFIKQEDKLKETFGRNLIQCLWPSVISNKNRIYLISSGKKITGKEIISGEWTGDAVSVPVYDSDGNVSESKTFYPEISGKSFKKIEITQTWFYNETRNIVFNKIPEIILFANIKDSSGNTELKPAIKIVF
jgi:hypothetical protein